MNNKLKLITLEEIEEESIKWLWKPYIPLGKITLVMGDGGIGKSTMILSLAADMTTGNMHGKSDIDEAVNIIYQTNEDSYTDTVKSRMRSLGADCNRVYIIDESDDMLTMSDSRIEEAIVRVNAKLLIFDPLQSFCGGSDLHSVNGMRPLLKQINGIAERTGCAIVLISHLNKGRGQAQYRGLGSIDIYAAARSVLTVGLLPEDRSKRVMIHTKSNLAQLGKPQSFELDENSNVHWLGECEITVDEMLSGKPKRESQLDKAKRLLKEILSCDAVEVTDIMELADEENISFKTFKRAKDILGVISDKRGGKWFWVLPIEATWTESTQEGQQTYLVPLAV